MNYYNDQRILGVIDKDPSAELPYSIDWVDWLDGQTISTSVWTVESGITLGSSGGQAPSATTTKTTCWLVAGTAGTDYIVTNEIVTNGGLRDQRSFRVRCIDR